MTNGDNFHERKEHHERGKRTAYILDWGLRERLVWKWIKYWANTPTVLPLLTLHIENGMYFGYCILTGTQSTLSSSRKVHSSWWRVWRLWHKYKYKNSFIQQIWSVKHYLILGGVKSKDTSIMAFEKFYNLVGTARWVHKYNTNLTLALRHTSYRFGTCSWRIPRKTS